MESELLWGLKDIFSLNGFVEISSEMKACFLHLPWNLLPPTWWVTKTLYPPAPAPPPQSHCGPPVKNICPPLASILRNIKRLAGASTPETVETLKMRENSPGPLGFDLLWGGSVLDLTLDSWTWRRIRGEQTGERRDSGERRQGGTKFSLTIDRELQERQLKLVPAVAIKEQMTRIWAASRSLPPASPRQPLMRGERRAKSSGEVDGEEAIDEKQKASPEREREREADAGRLNSSSHILITVIRHSVRLTRSRCHLLGGLAKGRRDQVRSAVFANSSAAAWHTGMDL